MQITNLFSLGDIKLNCCCQKQVNKYFFPVILPTFLIAAVYNLGYYHPDEHFQILEFAYCKLGFSTIENMPWEYEANIRPSLQPSIAYFFMKVMYIFKIRDPYFVALFFRFLSVFVCLTGVFKFVKSTLHMIQPPLRIWYVCLSFGLWFIPILSVRFSSETWSGVAFLIGLAFVLKQVQSKSDIYLSGIFLGLSFLFRYQSGIMIGGLMCWLLVAKPNKLMSIFGIGSTFMITLHLGLLLDEWFYGIYQLTPIRYLIFNLVHGIASSFGESPWYDALKYILYSPTFIIGFFMCGSLLLVVWKRRKHFLVWSLLPFIIVHLIIAHKELRFFFPVAWLIPLMMIIGIEEAAKFKAFQILKCKTHLTILLGSVFVLVNGAAMIIAIFRPAGQGETFITKYIDSRYSKRKVNLYFDDNSNVYFQQGLRNNFYSNPLVTAIDLEQTNYEFNSPADEGTVNLLVTRGYKERAWLDARKNLTKLTQSSSKVSDYIMEHGYDFNGGSCFVLFEIK